MWFWIYFCINIVVFIALYYKLMLTSDSCSMLLYPDLILWLCKKKKVKRTVAILYCILLTLVFAPTIFIWYLTILLRLVAVLISLLIILPFIKVKNSKKK